MKAHRSYPRPRRFALAVALTLLLAAVAASAPSDSARVVLFFGDSLSAGYGLPPEQAFPALVQVRLDSLGRDARVVNAGLPGETSAAGLRRVDWLLRRKVDVFVLELGGNDGLRGLPPAQTEANLRAILQRVRSTYPAAALVVAGVRLPPNLGPDYTTGFAAIFPRVAQACGAILIPSLLEGVGGDPALMQGDGIHPNAAGHRRVAHTVWAALAPLLAPAPADSAAAP